MLYLPVQEKYDVRLDSVEINLIIDALHQMERYLAEVVGCENEPQGCVQDHREALRALAPTRRFSRVGQFRAQHVEYYWVSSAMHHNMS